MIVKISLIITIILGLLVFEDCLKLYQETHYNLKTYILKIFKYYLKNYLFVFVYFYYVYLWSLSVLNIFISGVILIHYLSKKIINPMKYTPRILRQLLVIIGLICGAYFIFEDFLVLAVFSIFASYLLVFISGIIILPVELLIRSRYTRLANKKINNFKPFIIGITGSCGKTSIKNYIYQLLKEDYQAYISPKSYNTINGLNLTINKLLKHDDAYFILEMGASKKNDIKNITKNIKPNIAIVSEITHQHINTFKDINTILKEKMQIIENMKDGGTAYINYDNEYIRNYKIKKDCRVVKCGTSEDCDCYAYDIKHSLNGLEFRVKYQESDFEVKTKLVGLHNVKNLVISIAVAIDMGIRVDTIKTIVGEIFNPNHRLEIKKTDSMTIIDDSYNSNPLGFANALDVLNLAETKKILITPGIVDCGKMGYEINYGLAKKISEVCDEVILVDNVSSRYIKKGLDDIKYSNYSVVTSFKEGISKVKDGTVLIENDLTDGYFI